MSGRNKRRLKKIYGRAPIHSGTPMKNRFVFIIITAGLFFVPAFSQEENASAVRLLFFGDVNLGRSVGQMLLQGKTDYPFARVRDVLSDADFVFANLESVISDQHGETQSKRSNIVFCAPPVAGTVLRDAHVSVVSTANNHVYDYGMKGMRETMRYLREAGVCFVGTTGDRSAGCAPVIVEKHGIRIGFVAYTQSVNIGGAWRGYVSFYDSLRARKEIDSLKRKVDFVVASFHGGEEYSDTVDSRTMRQLRQLAEYGADLVIGHHPHVPQGVFAEGRALIFASLGNFVFYQPQRVWTQRSFGVSMEIRKERNSLQKPSFRLLPCSTGYQPSFVTAQEEADSIVQHIQNISNVTFQKTERGYLVQTPGHP
jgi:poly-gamma-glutamate synthesis protein (capsule biosynthesis protein)